jgi:hypothetical protein
VDNRGWRPAVLPILAYPLAHLELARAAAAAGDRATSDKTYARLLSLWADADPDLPALNEARREYAALRASAARPAP